MVLESINYGIIFFQKRPEKKPLETIENTNRPTKHPLVLLYRYAFR